MGVYGILIGEEDNCRFTERIIHGDVGGCTQTVIVQSDAIGEYNH